ncbi:sigma 54-interacting transcriptional regulator [Desulfofundulus thermosubterraneus]|uniref:Transcriptional regulator containing PAS, AAA-type ATPase, and DNA-binding Fis domains n=1 Tax=Desulfofundulus thermosubterraneus DSM 16057 TaxID=1121432 RepID=A0A1M6KYL2_9FIRM|nr:sigma 54-interacting transcriptional regulator [Desulfofundulus thermosubterraneus]SHJ64037.1 Transcriptional regulator containing PAS, AAA-type ATPase, and DNA-binding Fis domains [Desulfofundulus thermosubterraneus DSM 16057]
MSKRVGLAETKIPDLGDILDSLASNVVAVNKAGEIIYCSPQFARYLEMPREELIGRHINEFFPGTPLLDVLKDGRPQLGRRLQLKDGVYLVNRTPIWLNGEIVGAISEFQNINEIQNIIDELSSDNARIRELKNLLELILDLSSDGIVAIDRNYVITMANHNFASFWNKTPEEIIGKNVYEVYGESKPIFPRAMETGEAEYGYLGNLNGHEVIANRVPLIRDGEIVGALGVVAFRDVEELYALIKKIRHLKSELDYYKGELERVHRSKFSFDQIIGRNKQFEAVKETARRVAMTSSTVLILGESGTGKELFAHALHTEGLRSKGPFIKVNCAAVPENLLESELFGYVEGAFTGARKGGQPGKFELAHGGTIFLDEIGDMPMSMQAKLLRVLQEKEIERLGDTRPRRVDVRVVVATNQNLEELIGKGRFREDLYYRINVVTLNIPPLRERMDDLELLVEHFIKHFNRQFGQRVTGVSAEVMEILMDHHWPGNVRELENVLERAYNVLDGTVIQKKHLPLYLQKAGLAGGQRTGQSGLPRLVEEAEREAILEALAATKGNKRQAAQLLGISRAGLYKKLKRYQIEG